jgi:hypothetical protein
MGNSSNGNFTCLFERQKGHNYGKKGGTSKLTLADVNQRNGLIHEIDSFLKTRLSIGKV